jgi:integrase
MIVANHSEKGGRLYAADRTDKFRGQAEIAALLSVASPEIAFTLVLALLTGRRQGDLLRLPSSAYDGSYLRLRQSKTGRRIAMPAGMPLKVSLDSAERRGPLILTNSYGRPWTSDGFRTSWSKAFARAGVSGATFYDLRGSAVVRLALAEATVPQIATFS